MKPRTFMVYAHGRKVHARLIKHETKPRGAEVCCHNCGGSERLQFVAEAVQYSFVADMHWDVYNCQECGTNTAHQYEIELSLKEQVKRLK